MSTKPLSPQIPAIHSRCGFGVADGPARLNLEVLHEISECRYFKSGPIDLNNSVRGTE